MLETDDIVRLCGEIYHFSRKAELRWKAAPVLEFEFADLRDYHGARAQFIRALEPRLAAEHPVKAVGPDCEEIAYHGVIIRLRCRQKTMTRSGPLDASETAQYTFYRE